MNNNHMDESLNRTAYLKETDAETFALFAEFAYTGNYRCNATGPTTIEKQITPAKRKATDELITPSTGRATATVGATPNSAWRSTFNNTNSTLAFEQIRMYIKDKGSVYHCRRNTPHSGIHSVWRASYPFCCDSCSTTNMSFTCCVICASRIGVHTAVCVGCESKINPAAPTVENSCSGSVGWAKFEGQKLCVGEASHEDVQEWLKVKLSSSKPACFHAPPCINSPSKP